jgi:hypothetical protein
MFPPSPPLCNAIKTTQLPSSLGPHYSSWNSLCGELHLSLVGCTEIILLVSTNACAWGAILDQGDFAAPKAREQPHVPVLLGTGYFGLRECGFDSPVVVPCVQCLVSKVTLSGWARRSFEGMLGVMVTDLLR